MFCDRPLLVRDEVLVPCGKCPPCKKRRVDDWAFRLLHEYKSHAVAHFVTFTYAPEHVPISKNGFMTLRKKDFQDFMKRLRKRSGTQNIKYYACGEYGSTYLRPHYHAIIFGLEDSTLYEKAWTAGHVYLGTVTEASIGYVLKYIDKSQFRYMHGRDDREKEFPLMSKGLGYSYLTPDIYQYHKSDVSRTYVTRDGGYRSAIPRYYRERIYTPDERFMQRCLAQEAFADHDEQNRIRFDALKYPQSYAYGDHVASQKAYRQLLFNNNLNKRNKL